MSELQAEIVIRLMSDGKVGVKYSPVGPLFLYGMLENAKDVIRAKHTEGKSSILVPEAQFPKDFNPVRIKPDQIPPMMGNNGK